MDRNQSEKCRHPRFHDRYSSYPIVGTTHPASASGGKGSGHREHSCEQNTLGSATAWDPPAPSLRRDRLYETHGTYLTNPSVSGVPSDGGLACIDHQSPITFHLSPITFHLSLLTNH